MAGFGGNAKSQSTGTAMRNQFFLELETNGLNLGYVLHIKETYFGFGIGLGAGTFDSHTFDHKYVEGGGLDFFVRYQPKKFLQFDGGIEFWDGFRDEDDDKSAGFIGLKILYAGGLQICFCRNNCQAGRFPVGVRGYPLAGIAICDTGEEVKIVAHSISSSYSTSPSG